jgi:SAM-dependent methyltransferase
MSFLHAVPDREAVRRAYDLWSHVAGHRILDVGIGPGAYVSQVVRAAGPGASVYGVDFSDKMVRHAGRRLRREIGSGRATVIEADALYLPGGCRPVRLAHIVKAAGFPAPRRTVVRQALSSEILVASKPALSLSGPSGVRSAPAMARTGGV